MKELLFEGYSDDTFGECKSTHVDHDNCASGEPIALKVFSEKEDRGLIVVGQYCPDNSPSGTWLVGIQLLEEDMPFPDWSMKFTCDNTYTVSLRIEAPDDVTVEVCKETLGEE